MKSVILYKDTKEPIVLNFSEGTHRYKVADPLEYSGYKPGVTSILRVLNKPLLMQYAANKAVDTFYESYSEATELWNEEDFKDLCRKAKYAHLTYRDAKAEIGKKVHEWIEDYIAGKTGMSVEKEMEASIRAFIDWEAMNKPEYVFSEKILYSKKHDYCGTMDCAAVIDGIKTIIDFKTGEPDKEYVKRSYTGRTRSYNEHFIQTGGYSVALNEELKWQAEQLQTLYLPISGELASFTSPFVNFFQESFLSVLNLYKLLNKADKLNEYRS